MKKQKVMTVWLILILCISTLHSVAASDFSDGSDSAYEEKIAGEEKPKTEEQEDELQNFSSAGSVQPDEFTSDTEIVYSTGLMDSEIEEGLVYEYLPESNAYRVTKGLDQEKVTVPDKYQGKPVTEIGESAFAGFSKLKSIALPYDIIIRKDAFADCGNLRYARMGSVKSIESGAFKNCHKLTWLGQLSTDNQQPGSIADDAFDKDTKVVVVSDDNISDLRRLGIYNSSEIEWLWENGGVTYFNDRIIDFDNSIEEVVIASNHEMEGYPNTTIGRKAFYECDKVTSIELPETVKTIETKAFYGCSNLKKVVIPDSVTSISEDTFDNTPQVSIWASAESYAAKFANSHGIPLNETNEGPEAGTVKIAVNKNMVTATVLEYIGDGYDCILGTNTKDGRPIRGTGKLASKQTGKQIIFRNVPKGIYYLAIHPYVNTDNGKKYGSWSEIKAVKITVSTPTRPKVKSAKVSGKNLTVNVSLPKGAAGYNLVLGKTTMKNDSSAASILRPTKIAYQKNGQKKASVKLTKLKKGTYYIGVQTYNYQNGKKVYSQWSPLKNVKVS